MPLAPREGGQEPSWDSWHEAIAAPAASSAAATLAWERTAWGDIREGHNEVDLPYWDDAAGCWVESPGLAACDVAADQSYEAADTDPGDKDFTKSIGS